MIAGGGDYILVSLEILFEKAHNSHEHAPNMFYSLTFIKFVTEKCYRSVEDTVREFQNK